MVDGGVAEYYKRTPDIFESWMFGVQSKCYTFISLQIKNIEVLSTVWNSGEPPRHPVLI
jgi:hypothetical protein